MTPDKKSFNFQELLQVLYINIKVVFAVILFLGVFFALFFGYYSLILIIFAILFLIYSLIDTLKNRKEKDQEETGRE